MKLSSQSQKQSEILQKCVCQVSNSMKNHCKHSQVYIPHSQISSYQSTYTRHPINTWLKPPPEKAAPYTPYGNISSAYQEQFPGNCPQKRQKIVPKVKDQKKNITFNSTSEYSIRYPPKSVPKTRVFIKDNQFNPDRQPFQSATTYGSEFYQKQQNPHDKKDRSRNDEVFPEGYKFNPTTTYNKDFFEKQPNLQKNYKPEEKVAEKGPHYMTSIYNQDFRARPQTLATSALEQ